jgi:hypothetical protein
MTAETDLVFKRVLEAAIKQRPNLGPAIGFDPDRLPLDSGGVADELACMYRIAEGTRRDIEDQSAMDIVPGYRLIHRDELAEETDSFRRGYDDLPNHLPFLADYASCFYTVDIDTGLVHMVDPVFRAGPISDSLLSFWRTMLACYLEGAYGTDEDGFLACDDSREAEIGARLNPEYEFWTEDV